MPFSNLKSLMVFPAARVWEAVELLRLGVSSNWFGLACPAHCSPSTFSSLGLSFLLGLLIGGILASLSTAYIIYCLAFHFPAAHHHPVGRRALNRLRGYLDE